MSEARASSEDGLTDSQRRAIVGVFAQFAEVQKASLYGSRALGRYRPGSDIDLTLVGPLDLQTLNRISVALDDLLLPYVIDLSIFSQIDNDHLRAHIERVGVEFYSVF